MYDQPCNVLPSFEVPEDPRPKIGRTLQIRPLNFGYVIEVGCQSFAFETKEKLIANLSSYLNDPDATERKWFSGELLK